MADLNQLRTQAEQGVQDVANLQQNVPGLLSGIQKNLTSIFSKDNPLIQKREGLLADYLSTPERTSASLLPANLPMVAGSNLNLSPTQQSAIRSSREAAAFAPLASLNNLIVGQYGNIGDIVRGAADQYQAQLAGAQTRQSGIMDLYKQAYQEQQDRQKLSEPSLGAQIAALLGGQTGQREDTPDINKFLDSLVEPDLEDIIQESFNKPRTSIQPMNLDNRTPPSSAQLRFTL